MNNFEKYNKLHNEIMKRLEDGEITVETAKEVIDASFEKYIYEKQNAKDEDYTYWAQYAQKLVNDTKYDNIKTLWDHYKSYSNATHPKLNIIIASKHEKYAKLPIAKECYTVWDSMIKCTKESHLKSLSCMQEGVYTIKQNEKTLNNLVSKVTAELKKIKNDLGEDK